MGNLYNDLNDEELMMMYVNNDAQAFRVLFERHSPKVYGYIYKKIQNQEKAQDLLQTAFLKLHENKDKYKSDFPFLNWFFVIIRNTIIDDIRKNKIKWTELKDSIPSPETISTPDITPHIQSAPEAYREALYLRYVEDKDFSEIAQKLNTSEANIRKKMSRGIEYIKQKMKGGAS